MEGASRSTSWGLIEAKGSMAMVRWLVWLARGMFGSCQDLWVPIYIFFLHQARVVLVEETIIKKKEDLLPFGSFPAVLTVLGRRRGSDLLSVSRLRPFRLRQLFSFFLPPS